MAISVNDFIQQYNNLVAANGGTDLIGAPASTPQQFFQQQAQQQQQLQQAQAPAEIQGFAGRITEQEQEPVVREQKYRQMNPIEMGLTGIRGFGEDVLAGANEITGFNPEAGFTVENVARMIPTLPAQMLSGVTEGLSQGYEAVTRKNIIEGADLEAGTTLDYDLTAGEAGAQALNFGLNVGGIFTGGTARGVGMVGKLATGGKAFNRMAKGSFASETAGKAAGFVGQAAFDTAEEAGEEFVQAYLDEARFHHNDGKTFERAVEGAAWGALGGGAMSVVMQGANAAYDAFKNANQNQNQNQQQQNTFDPTQSVQDKTDDYNEMRGVQGDFNGMDYSRAAARDIIGSKDRGHPGSDNVTNATTRADLDVDDFIFGDENIQAIYRRSNADQVVIQNWLGVDKATADAAFFMDENGNYHAKVNGDDRIHKTVAGALNDILGGRKIETAFTRNPDTKNGGFLGYIKEFHHGSGLQSNSAVMSMVGADFDADKTAVFFDTSRINVNGYAHDMLMSSEGERSNIDWSLLLKPEVSENEVRNKMSTMLSPYGQELSDDITNGLVDAFKLEPGDDRNAMLSSTLTRMQQNIDAVSGTPGTGTSVFNQFVNEFRGSRESIIEREFSRLMDDVEGELINELNMLRTGSVKDTAQPLKLFRALGLNAYQLTGKGNAIFRQYAQIYFEALNMKAHGTFSKNAEELSGLLHGQEDVVRALMRASLRMEASGVSPTATIEGLVDAAIVAETWQTVGFDFKLKSDKDFEALMSAFVNSYNKYAKIFNKAQKDLTTDGWDFTGDGRYKNQLDTKDLFNTNSYRAFIRSFGMQEMDEIFYAKDMPTWMSGRTLNSVLSEFVGNGYAPRIDLMRYDNLQKFFNSLIRNFESERKAVSSRAQKMITEYDVEKVLQSYEKNGELTPSESLIVAAYFDGINMIVSPEIGISAGLRSAAALDTKVGKMLFSRNEKTRLRAIVGMSMQEQFRPIIENMNSNDPKVILQVKYDLETKARVSPVHARICQQLAQDGHSDLLMVMTDFDITWDNLEEQTNRHLDGIKYDLFLDSVRTESSDFDISGFSDRVKKAENAITKSVRLHFETERGHIEQLKRIVNGSNDGKMLEAWFMDTVQNARAQIDTQTMGAKLWATMYPSHDAVEKATIQSAAYQHAVANQMVQNGRQLSFMDSYLSEPFGEVRIDVFQSSPYYMLKCLADPEVEYIVTDPTTGRYLHVNRDVILKSASPGYNGTITSNDIFALLDENPQLAGWFCKQQPQYTVAGSRASVTGGRIESVVQSYEKYLSSRRSPDGKDRLLEREIADEKLKVENWLLNQPEYESYLVACASDRLRGIRTPKEAVKVMNEIHDKAVNGFYTALMKGGKNPLSSDLQLMMRDFRSSTRAKIIRDTRSLMNAATSTMSILAPEAKATLQDALKTQIANGLLLDVVNKHGVNIDNINYPGLKEDIASISNHLNQEIEEGLRADIDLLVLMLRLYDQNISTVFAPDATLLSGIEAACVSQGIDFSSIMDDLTGELETLPTLIGSVDVRTVFTNDIQFSQRTDFLEFVKKIADECGAVVDNDEIIEDWNVYSQGGRDAQNIRAKWNNMVVRSIADSTNARLGSTLNGNLFASTDNAIDRVDDWISRMMNDLDLKYKDAEYINQANAIIPVPSYVDEYTELLANNMQLMSDGGYGEMAVSLNGSMAKHISGLGYLPKFIMPPVAPEQLTVGEVVRQAEQIDSDMDNWHYMLSAPTGNESAADLRVIGRSVTELRGMDPATPIWVFNPKRSPHGCDSAFVPAAAYPGGKEYHRFGRILLDINSYAQEGMVLKAKKVLGKKKNYLADVHRIFATSKNIALENKVLQDAMYRGIISYRDAMADELLKDINKDGRLESLGAYGLEECLILAQGCTPGIEITLSNGDMFIVDTNIIFGDPSIFERHMNRITDNGNLSVVNADVLVVSPVTVSYKILRAVSDAYHNKKRRSNDSIRKAASRALNDWSDIKPDSLDIDEILAGCTHVGRSFDTGLLAEGSRTAMQYFLDHDFDYGYGATTNDVHATARIMDKEAKAKYEILQQASIDVFKAQNIVRVFFNENSPIDAIDPGSAARRARYHSIEDEKFEFRSMPGTPMRAIVLDNTKLGEAVEWSRKTGGTVLVDKETFDLLGADLQYHSDTKKTETINNQTYYELNFMMSSLVSESLAGALADQSTYLDPSQIRPVFVDEDNIFQVGDAVIKADPSIGHLLVNGYGVTNISIPSLFRNSKTNKDEFAIATKEEINDLKNRFANNRDSFDAVVDWSSAGTVSVKRMDEMMSAFFGSVDNESMRVRNVPHNEIVCFVKNGSMYAPIIMPRTAPPSSSSVVFDLNGGDAILVWNGEGGFGVDQSTLEYVKGALDNEAFKGMITMFENGQRAPKLPVGDHRCAMVVSSETESSRAHGRDKQFLVNTLRYQTALYDMSLLFEEKSPGVFGWRSDIESKIPPSILSDLSNNNKSAWQKVLNGMELTDDAELNKIIKKLVRLAFRFKQNPVQLLSSYNLDGDKRMPINREFYHHQYYDYLSDKELFKFFSEWKGDTDGRRLCVPIEKFSIFMDDSDLPLVDKYGRTMAEVNGKFGYYTIRWGTPRVIGAVGNLTAPTGHAQWGWQHIYNRGVENGYLDREFKEAIEYTDFLLGSSEFLDFHRLPKVPDTYSPGENTDYSDVAESIGAMIEEYPGLSYNEIRYRQEVNERATDLAYVRSVHENGERIENPADHPEIKRAMDRLNTALQFDSGYELNYNQINIGAGRQTGFTYNKNGENTVSLRHLVNAIDAMTRIALSDKKVPIANEVSDGKTGDNRWALPMLTEPEVEWWWHSKVLRQAHGDDLNSFKDAIKEQSDKALQQLQYIDQKDLAKRRALERAFTYDYWQNGYQANTGRISGYTSIQDIAEADTRFADAWHNGEQKGGIEIDRATWNSLSERSRNMLSDLANYAEYKNRVRSSRVRNVDGRANLTIYLEDGRTINTILDDATQLSKIMALINPGVLASNLIDRGVHQGIMNFAIRLGHTIRIGPYGGKAWMNQDIVTGAINNEFLVDLYGAYRMAQFTGEEFEFLTGMSENSTNIKEWLAQRKANMSPYQRAVDRIYDISTGGNKFLKNQIRNFLNRFVMFCEQNPEQGSMWLEVVSHDQNNRPIMRIEQALMDNPGGWFLEVMGSTRSASPSLELALQAMNSAKQGDLAQRNVLTMLFRYATKDTPLSNFLVTTTMMRFPEYTLNVSGRMLNWLLPMSTINYVFTERLAQWGAKQGAKEGKFDPHFEIAQVHASLKEAMMVDITHLGVGAVTLILVSMAGGIEPPEDEKKWGNPDEWIICGLRVGEAWWIEDILGIALPMACFTRSAQLGNPRFDLLFNGLNQACYNNPIVKVSDAVGFLMEPEGRFVTDFNEDVINYQNAKGGPPSYTDWLQANALNFGLSWASQFFTPSILREWYNNSRQWEVSYKKVFKETPTGVLSQEGVEGETENTTYQDAMIRRATRRNPMLGYLMNLISGGNKTTGYLAWEMPDVIYYDDAQIASMEQWSIDGLSDAEAQAKILEIITVMQQYDDMDELRATGFFLDGKTKAALSSVVWDTIYEFDDFINNLKAQGKNDFYYLGNGDYITGQMIWKQLEQSVDEQKRAWQNFYYDKVRSSALSEPLVTYKRYNTTYAQDEDGNFYATGFRPAGVLPFISAPGTMSSPEGTAGYENDWVTVSAVTGQPIEGKRALVPIEGDMEEWPDLEYWAGNKDGTGHSALYKQWYGTGGDGTLRGESAGDLKSLSDIELPEGLDLSKDPDKTSRYPSRSYSRRSGGGGGRSYSRRSGGGGGYGGSAPNIYSRVNPPNLSNPESMRSSRIYDAEYDYLRPNFETKGSREAYKRGDI